MDHGVRQGRRDGEGPGSGVNAIRSIQPDSGIEVVGIKDAHADPAQTVAASPKRRRADGSHTGPVCRLSGAGA